MEDISLYRLYALLVLVKEDSVTRVTDEDVHNAWAVWACENDPEHRSLIPFDELPARVQALDAPYTAAIHAAASTVKSIKN